MNNNMTDNVRPQKPLRLWPGVLFALLLVLFKLFGPVLGPGSPVVTFLGGLVAGFAIVLWWLFFSRAPWFERLGAVVLMVVALLATRPFLHDSIAGAGMGMLFFLLAIPGMSLALVAWAAASRRLSKGPRRIALVAAIMLASGAWALLRTGGISGEGSSDLQWRWSPTAEERLLAQAADDMPAGAPVPAPPEAAPIPSEPESTPAATPTREQDSTRAAAAAPSEREAARPGPAPSEREATRPGPAPSEREASRAGPAMSEREASRTGPAMSERRFTRVEWTGFRGPARDGILPGVRINTDWSASPPVEIWRRAIGPGWSSFAVRGDLLYTQEQRGDDEVVACYRLSTGEPVWRHRDPVRFWESNAGAGPRATPTIDKDRVYAFGATGMLNALDASTGAVVWSRNVATDTKRTVPDWGFASSPLATDDVLIVAASGTLAAYDLANGNLRWSGPRLLGSYSSPHRATIDGVTQVVFLSGSGAAGVTPTDGTVLWQHDWKGGGTTIVQPAVTADGDILINAVAGTGGMGMRRLDVKQHSGGWAVETRWTSTGLKPYFNDFVVHKGHAFGFDGSILAAIDLADGTRKWKGGRYGNGQLMLLPEQDLLLVLSEEGELALVGATPDQFKELARFPALNAKTWNHPVMAGDVLLVRNGEEMAAFRLSLASR